MSGLLRPKASVSLAALPWPLLPTAEQPVMVQAYSLPTGLPTGWNFIILECYNLAEKVVR